eukprot:gnl/Trimastix_PCT/1195.p1 GENE.gnl/Trimastix_PCT/1195~~gnl/Trimastix_PCT/1195.p1  ORF type:complete len:520 (+),score=172.52 gnl/Trimastix_PCT/1195:72-1562(+)
MEEAPNPAPPPQTKEEKSDEFVWKRTPEGPARDLAAHYLEFLRTSRTERERTAFVARVAETKGFRRLDIGENVARLSPGERVYYVNRGKNIVLAVIGERPLTEESNFIAAHIDSPRLDVKVNPLYEKDKCGIALFKTHYYGGVKKYQWASIPLHLVGVVVKRDGSVVNVDIGTDPMDPVFCAPDVLIHLWGKVQRDRKAHEVIKGEELNVVMGSSQHLNGEGKPAKDAFKTMVLQCLHAKYGIAESDLHTAELTFVSGLTPRFVGIDRCIIGGAAQDDGICGYTAFIALLQRALGNDAVFADAAPGATPPPPPRYTAAVGLFDKEEIGSYGCTGMRSSWLRFVWNDLLVRQGANETLTNLHLAMSRTKFLSADVIAGINPNFESVHDPLNAASLGKGLCFAPYLGAYGKSGTSEVNAEFMVECRNRMEAAGVPFQFGNLGKVDEGGGGTVSKFLAESFNADVVDCGPPLLGMHSPFELSHIADVYWTTEAFRAFFQ